MNQRMYYILGGVPNIDRSDQTYHHYTSPNVGWQTRPHTYLRRHLRMLQPTRTLIYQRWGICIIIQRVGGWNNLHFLIEGHRYSLDGAIELVEYKLGLRLTAPQPFKDLPAVRPRHALTPARCYQKLSYTQRSLLLYYYDLSIGIKVEKPAHNRRTQQALITQGWIEMHDYYGLQITDWAREIVAQELTARAG